MKILKSIALSSVLILACTAYAQVITVPISPLTTSDSDIDPINSFDNNGIWFTMTGTSATVISDGSFPGYASGQFQLNTNTFYASPEAKIYTQSGLGTPEAVVAADTGAFSENPARLSVGTVIDASSFNATGTLAGADFIALAGPFGNWNSDFDTIGYIGVRFDNGGNSHFGFVQVGINPTMHVTLYGWAYEATPGTPITIQNIAVPEPSTYALMTALIAFAFIRHIRRRRC